MTWDFLTNHAFNALQPGSTASLVRIAARNDVDLFAAASGDVKLVHHVFRQL